MVETLAKIFSEDPWAFQTWQNSNKINVNIINSHKDFEINIESSFW